MGFHVEVLVDVDDTTLLVDVDSVGIEWEMLLDFVVEEELWLVVWEEDEVLEIEDDVVWTRDELLVLLEVEDELLELVWDDVEWTRNELVIFIDPELVVLFWDDVLLLELEPTELLVEEGNFEELLRIFDVVEEMELVIELPELLEECELFEAEITELLDELLRLLVELVESGKLVDCVLVLLDDCELLEDVVAEMLAEDPVEAAADWSVDWLAEA
jgi:hypothetical protein